MSAGELRALLVGLTMDKAGVAMPVKELEDDINYLMSQFDSNRNGEISRNEFHSALLQCGSSPRSTTLHANTHRNSGSDKMDTAPKSIAAAGVCNI